MSAMSEEVSVINQQGGAEEEAQQQLNLPPGFRFHPTDLELVHHYLTRKVLDRLFSSPVIADVNLNKCEPWDLPGKAKMGEKEWYFFWHKDRKYPTGTRTNRATARGYWKATGKDKEVFRGRGVLVGMKKTLVFYLGRAPNGEKTPWVMHEYRLEGKLPPNLPPTANKDEWAVCRVINKDLLAAKDGQQPAASSTTAGGDGMERNNSSFLLDGFFDTTELPPLMDSPFVDDDLLDFTGAADVVGTSTSSSSGTMVAGTSSSSSGYQVKTEQQKPAAQNPYCRYSSPPPLLPATNDNNYPQQAADRGEQPLALPDADAVWKSPFPELDDLCADNDFMDDYSSMWKV